MKICIDARSPGLRGPRTYIDSLLESLLKVDRNNDYLIITDRQRGSWGYDGVDEIMVPSVNPLHWMVWSNTVLQGLLERCGVDVYHSVKHVTAYRLKAKKVLTLHGGVMLDRFPNFYKWHDRMYWKYSYRMAFRTYERIITATEAEKRHYVEKHGSPETKFRITNFAADQRFRVVEDEEEKRNVRGKYNLPKHFILYAGWIHPHKNIEGVIKGYNEARHLLGAKQKLVIMGGGTGPYFEQIIRLISKLRMEDDVIFLGYIQEGDVPYVYNLADLFLFPTNYESFGIVLLEAMASGVPVITSNIRDIDEVVEDATVRVDPTNSSEIGARIVEVLSSPDLRKSLREQGLERATLFSWDRCARETIKVYEELSGG